MNGRDRSSGWKHAKLSGHKNEVMVAQLLDTNFSYRKEFLKRGNASEKSIRRITIGGLHETNVPSVLGRSTKSKTDLKITFDDEDTLNFSIKKSAAGQVYFLSAENFIQVFEKQFEIPVPESVRRAMRLFWAAAEDAESIIDQYGDRSKERDFQLQMRHKSLNAETLRAYDSRLWEDILKWFAENAYELTALAFSMGSVRDSDQWSDHIWYINLIGENDMDDIFPISKICRGAKACALQETYYGESNGGTTIQLPFGFVQWHQGKMQFHHNYQKIKSLLEK